MVIFFNEQDITRIRNYIANNPLKWEEDTKNINHQGKERSRYEKP